jgi:hypothetical protein
MLRAGLFFVLMIQNLIMTAWATDAVSAPQIISRIDENHRTTGIGTPNVTNLIDAWPIP